MHRLSCTGDTLSKPDHRTALDCVDIHVEVPPGDYEKLPSECIGEPSSEIRVRACVSSHIEAVTDDSGFGWMRSDRDGTYCGGDSVPPQETDRIRSVIDDIKDSIKPVA